MHYAAIHCFIKTIHQNCNENSVNLHRKRYYAIVQKIAIVYLLFVMVIIQPNSFLQTCHKIDNFIAIFIETLKCVCVYMKISIIKCTGMPINQKELE